MKKNGALFIKKENGTLLTILEIVKKTNKSNVVRKHAICKCICGNICEPRLENVLNKKTMSCGCMQNVSRNGLLKKYSPCYKGIEEISGQYLNDIKRFAIRRNKIFNLTKEYLWDLYIKQNKKCSLSGLDIVFGPGFASYLTTASLDRIDSSKGYIEGNV